MDRFTRNYSIALGLIALIAVIWIARASWQPQVWKINEILEADSALASYDYQFRVKSLNDGVAVISTPRSFDVPAIRFIEIIRPKLAGLAQDDPRVVAAQQELINHQKYASELVAAQPQVERVEWQLDTQWLADHGVQAPNP